MTLTTGAGYLKRGDTFDPEDHRMTHRLQVARAFLGEVGIKATVEHGEQCARHPKNIGTGIRANYCWYNCVTVWPEWVTDDMFEHAFTAGNALQNLRGEAARAQIAAHREKVTA